MIKRKREERYLKRKSEYKIRKDDLGKREREKGGEGIRKDD